jgi:hypothetical protein
MHAAQRHPHRGSDFRWLGFAQQQRSELRNPLRRPAVPRSAGRLATLFDPHADLQPIELALLRSGYRPGHVGAAGTTLPNVGVPGGAVDHVDQSAD